MKLVQNITTGLISEEEKAKTKEFVKNYKHKKPAIKLKQGHSFVFENFKKTQKEIHERLIERKLKAKK